MWGKKGLQTEASRLSRRFYWEKKILAKGKKEGLVDEHACHKNMMAWVQSPDSK